MRSEDGADPTHQFTFSSSPRPGRAGGNIKTWRDQSDQLMETYLSLYSAGVYVMMMMMMVDVSPVRHSGR